MVVCSVVAGENTIKALIGKIREDFQ